MERGLKWAVMVLGITVVVCSGIWGFLLENMMNIDDVTLFNPIYTYLHYNVMAYPSYGYFDAMVVHPPTHYFVSAVVMKMGLPLFYATALPQFLLVLLIVGFTVTSRWPNMVRAAVLFGSLAGLLFPWYAFKGSSGFGVRPDLHMALAWFAGLVALETGRLDGWRPWRLAAGAFLLAYASGIHYPAIMAWSGVMIYLVWLIRAHGRHHARKAITALLFGLCAFGVPYLALFWIPHWEQIMGFISLVGPTGSAWTSLQAHLQLYTLFFERTDTVSRVLFAFLSLGIPTVIVSTTVLGFSRDTRGLALAGLPHLLFILLVLRRKGNNHDYLLPEYMAYVTAVTLLALRGISLLAGTLSERVRQTALTVSVGLLAGILGFGTPWLKGVTWSTPLRPNEMDMARAAGRLMLGPDALVGHRIGRFYTSGAARSHYIQPDLGSRKLEAPEVLSYLSEFDALAEDTHMSNEPLTSQGEALTSWYVSGDLSLRGFYFSARHNALSYLLLSTRLSHHLEGYGTLADGQALHFQATPDGHHLFLTAVCEAATPSGLSRVVLFQNTLLMPVREGEVQKILLTVVAGPQEADTVRREIGEQCTAREIVVLRATPVDSRTLLKSLNDDKPITFLKQIASSPLRFTVPR